MDSSPNGSALRVQNDEVDFISVPLLSSTHLFEATHGFTPGCRTVHRTFLLSRIRSTQRESIVIVKKFEFEILTNLHVLDFPESEKHNFGIMSVCVSVCEHDNSKTIRATGILVCGL
ncbi:hypothetical protein AVEN_27215-1 [Araneus ventricosus]|uniref:Uncharacterized protein n=1 Tax=Araneus ventricosus TaxID=182803 RepID=A0A4Y2DXE3_ARAVE|nr:hypothetical protein AVEN_27215-1 [Araneus ventricosus]